VMGFALAILIYLAMLWYDVWEIIPEEHKFWVGLALVLLALSESGTKVIYRDGS